MGGNNLAGRTMEYKFVYNTINYSDKFNLERNVKNDED